MARGRRPVARVWSFEVARDCPKFRVSPAFLADVRSGLRTTILRSNRYDLQPGSHIELYTFPRDFSIVEVVDAFSKPLNEFTDDDAKLDGHESAEAFREAVKINFPREPSLTFPFTLIRFIWR